MLVLKSGQMNLWEQILPEELKKLPKELEVIDKILEDPCFFEPYLKKFNTKIGRPTVKVETYIRMMFLKTRYQFGYETLVSEVSDSISWRRFCHLSIDEKVPHSTTLIKLSKKYGSIIMNELNQALLVKANNEKIIRGRKLRIDTTVVESDIHHPTDTGLLHDGIKAITRTVKKIKESGAAVRTKFQNRVRSSKKRVLNITKVLRRRTGEAIHEVDKITAQLVTKAEAVVGEAQYVLKNTSHKIWRDGKKACKETKRLASKLKQQLQLTDRIIAQSKEVISGNRIIPNRLVSLFDPDARPIKKGKLKSPTEFGYKAMIQETEERVVTGYEVYQGNPSDESLLPESLDKHEKLFGRVPRKIATDRGFGSRDNEELCTQKGVKKVSLPVRGKLSKKQKLKERQPWFKELQRWRAGGEATISVLKRKYGLGRSLSRGFEGTKTWVAMAIFNYNLRRMATLMKS